MDQEEFYKKLKLKQEDLVITIEDNITKKKIKFNIVNKKTLWRAQTLYSKEPITIEWIRKFEKNKIFYDVGANIGVYSIFGSIISDVKVFSFEPEINNFYILNKNILLNKLNQSVSTFLIGINNETTFTKLHLGENETGGSHHFVGKSALDHNLKQRTIGYHQNIFSISLDDLCKKWNFPIPNYLKIDVDGIENQIIEKSDFILSSKKLESILIEINSNREEDNNIISKLNKYNFKFDNNQVEKSMRKIGRHKGYAEYLFYR